MSEHTLRPDLKEIIVVGLGVRHLAESARQAGLRVTAVDAFADEDTASAGLSVRVAKGTARGLTRAALRLGSPGNGLIYGGGFEGRVDQLRHLSKRMRLFGNRPSVAALVADPRRFFGLLDDLKIPHPEVRLDAPEDSCGWLLKRGASCGGAGVCAADAEGRSVSRPDSFYQRWVDGPVVSVLFAASGNLARIIGYSRLFSENRRGRPYAYAGATTWYGPDPATRRMIGGYVQRLTRAIGLIGINGLDLLISRDGVLVLELNARPTATLELHENRLPGGSVASHLAACAGRLPEPIPGDPGVARGYRVVYTDRPLVAPSVTWPAWVRDRPRGGVRFGRDAPLCTVHATCDSLTGLENRLDLRARHLISMFDHGDTRAA